MSGWYDYPTERPSLRPIFQRPPHWSRAAINAANSASPAQPGRNAQIIEAKLKNPDASFTEIGRLFGVSRNLVAGVLDRAKRKADRERRSPAVSP
jgi:hypothetical protein